MSKTFTNTLLTLTLLIGGNAVLAQSGVKRDTSHVSQTGTNQNAPAKSGLATQPTQPAAANNGMTATAVRGGYIMTRTVPLPAAKDNPATNQTSGAVKTTSNQGIVGSNTAGAKTVVPGTATNKTNPSAVSSAGPVNGEMKKSSPVADKKNAAVNKPASLVTNKKQAKQDTITTIKRAQNLYLELGGPGLAISANFDTRFGKRRDGLGYRIGMGYFFHDLNTVFTIPAQINYLFSTSTNGFIELGAGGTFLNSTGDNKDSIFIFDRVTGVVATGTIGYRYQPQKGGMNFRIGFVPILYDEGLIPAGGISVGYTLK